MPGSPFTIYDGPSVIRQQGQMTGGGDSVGGVAVSGTPSNGQVLTATSATAANWQAGGGGGVTTREQFLAGSSTSVASGSFTNLPWVKASGDTLLDLTVPALPTVITAGVYAVNVGALMFTAPAATGKLYFELDLDNTGEDALASMQIPIAASGAADDEVSPSLTLVYYVPAGGQLAAGVTQNTGGALNFRLQAVVQRIS